MCLVEVRARDGASTGDRTAGVLGLAVELAIPRGGTRMGRMGQGSSEVCHSMESLPSLNHRSQ